MLTTFLFATLALSAGADDHPPVKDTAFYSLNAPVSTTTALALPGNEVLLASGLQLLKLKSDGTFATGFSPADAPKQMDPSELGRYPEDYAISTISPAPGSGFLLEITSYFDAFLLKLKPDFSRDSTFGQDGLVHFPDGRPEGLVVGESQLFEFMEYGNDNEYGRIKLKLISLDGRKITESDPEAALYAPDQMPYAWRPLALGENSSHGVSFVHDNALFQLLPNGMPDPGFGGGGVRTFDTGGELGVWRNQSDGGYWLIPNPIGFCGDPYRDSKVAIYRLAANGRPILQVPDQQFSLTVDASFAKQISTHEILPRSDGTAYAVMTANLVPGTCATPGTSNEDRPHLVVAKLLADGTPDPSYRTRSLPIIIGYTNYTITPKKSLVRTDGSILVLASCTTGTAFFDDLRTQDCFFAIQ